MSALKAMYLYVRGVMRGALRGVRGMRDECLRMRVINCNALRCARDLTGSTEAVVRKWPSYQDTPFH